MAIDHHFSDLDEEEFPVNEEIVVLERRGTEIPKGFDNFVRKENLNAGDLSKRENARLMALMDLLAPGDRAIVEECYGSPSSRVPQ